MDWQWILLPFLCSLLSGGTSAKEIVAQVNTKRLVQYVPERFLSMSVDPKSILLAGHLGRDAVNMARGLSPSFLRLGGQATNFIRFGKDLFTDNNTITEEQWDSVNRFAQDAGLDVIASLNPTDRIQDVWDSRDALQIISHSDKHGYSLAWQLGYDTKGAPGSGLEMGRDVVRLRKILDGFHRYVRAPLLGPDIVSPSEGHYMRDFLSQAAPVVSAIVLQPNFKLEEDPSHTITSMILEVDSLVWGKDIRFGRVIPRKPIWIADKEPSRGTSKEAIALAKRLGAAAKIGCQLVLRQPGPRTLKTPTPEFWMALLYKNLVGRGVFDTRITSGNRTEIHIFSHCTPHLHQDKSVLDSAWIYDKGAVTVFGVNESPENIKIALKASMKDEPIHAYILTFNGDQSGKIEDTYLNGQPLQLSPSGELPVLAPRVRRPNKYGLTIPTNSVFFLVLPEVRSRICSSIPNVMPEVQELSKRLLQVAADVLEKPHSEHRQSTEEETSGEVYVKFKSPKINEFRPPQARSHYPVTEKPDPDVQVKYITYSDNNGANKLAETAEHTEDEEVLDEDTGDKYAALTAAIAGVQNSTEPESEDRRRRKRSASSDNDMEVAASNSVPYISHEELVNQLNKFSQEVYKSGESVEISNIPKDLLNTLKRVRVTFKHLGPTKPSVDTNGGFEIGEPVNSFNEDGSQQSYNQETAQNSELNDLARYTQPENLNLEDLSKVSEFQNEQNANLEEEQKENTFRGPTDSSLIDYNVYNPQDSPQGDRGTEQSFPGSFSGTENEPTAQPPGYGEFQSERAQGPTSFVTDGQVFPPYEPAQDGGVDNPEAGWANPGGQADGVDAPSQYGGDPQPAEPLPPSQDPAADFVSGSGTLYSTQTSPETVINEQAGPDPLTSRDNSIKYVLKRMPPMYPLPVTDSIDEDRRTLLIPFNPASTTESGIFSTEQNNQNIPGNEWNLPSEEQNKNNENEALFSPSAEELPPSTDPNSDSQRQGNIENTPSTSNAENNYELGSTSENYNGGDQVNEEQIANESPPGDNYVKELSESSNALKPSDNTAQLEFPTESSPRGNNEQSYGKELGNGPDPPAEDWSDLTENRKFEREIPVGVTPEFLEDPSLSSINTQDDYSQVSNGQFITPETEFNSQTADLGNSIPESPTSLLESGNNGEDSLSLVNQEVSPNEASFLSEKQVGIVDDDIRNLEPQNSLPESPEELQPGFDSSNGIGDVSPSEVTKDNGEYIPPGSDITSLPERGVSINTLGTETLNESPLNQIGGIDNAGDSPFKTNAIKSSLDKERRERLQALRDKWEARGYRYPLRDDSLRAVLLRKQEEIRRLLNQDRTQSRYGYPPSISRVDPDRTLLSRTRRLSYFPEDGFSAEDLYDYTPEKLYHKRSDSYGRPISDDYDRPYLSEEIIPSPIANTDRSHVLFPIDPKTPQAVVFNNKIIPAKLYGVISLNDELKSNTIDTNRNIPDDSIYSRYYTKYDTTPIPNEKFLSQSFYNTPRTRRENVYSLPLTKPSGYNSAVKSLEEEQKFIPIVILTPNAIAARRRRAIEDEAADKEADNSTEHEDKEEEEEANVAKAEKSDEINSDEPRSLKTRRSLNSNNIDNEIVYDPNSYAYLNEIPRDNNEIYQGGSVKSVISNDIHNQELYKYPSPYTNEINDINSNQNAELYKMSNSYPDLTSKNEIYNYNYMQPANNDPMMNFNDISWSSNDDGGVSPRTFISLPQSPVTPSNELNNFGQIDPSNQEDKPDPPSSLILNLLENKFKAMLSALQGLAEWCAYK